MTAERKQESSYYLLNGGVLPAVRLIGEEHLEPPYIHRRRCPGEYILYFLTAGSMELEEDGIRFHLKPGDILILDPDKVHVGRRATTCTYFYIHFMWEGIEKKRESRERLCERMMRARTESLRSDPCGISPELCSCLFLPKYANYAGGVGFSEMKSRIGEALSVHRDRREGYKALVACEFLSAMILASRQYLSLAAEAAGGEPTRRLHSLINYLNTHYGEEISGAGLEERFGGSFDYMNRQFRRATGRTIFAYLCTIRIAGACELMKTGSLRVSDIGESVGFHDSSYFSKVFRKHVGMSPLEYRKQAGV